MHQKSGLIKGGLLYLDRRLPVQTAYGCGIKFIGGHYHLSIRKPTTVRAAD